MSDIAFNPVISTNEIFRANDRTRFLTNDLDAIEADYDTANSTAINSDVCTTIIPKKNCVGANWSGQAFLATVPIMFTTPKSLGMRRTT